MYSRVTLLEIDTLRVGMEEAAGLFREQVVPGLRAQDGYHGVSPSHARREGNDRHLLGHGGAGARDIAGFAPPELERFVTMFRSPPGREFYEVLSRTWKASRWRERTMKELFGIPAGTLLAICSSRSWARSASLGRSRFATVSSCGSACATSAAGADAAR